MQRYHKLAWIAFIAVLVGLLIAQVLGAATTAKYWTIAAIPTGIAALIGFVALAPDGKLRNGNIVLAMIAGVLLIVVALIVLSVYVINSSTDL